MDGTPFAFGTTLGPPDPLGDNYIAAYTRTHGGKGFYQVSANLSKAFGGGLAFRPAGLVDKATSAFLGGYYDNVDLALAPYHAPLAAAQVSAGFVSSMGKGTFALGTDINTLTNTLPFTFALSGKATSPTAGFTLTVDRKTGLYRGTRPNPTLGGKPIPFGGALLQTLNAGTGLGTGFGNSHDATTAHRAFIVPRP